MREFFDRLNLRIAEFMNGRYGMDSLNKLLLILGLVTVIFGSLISPIDLLGWVFLVLAIIRGLSRNFSRRQAENDRFLKITTKPKKIFQRLVLRWKNRKTTIYFKCANCKQNLSVPRGKGKIRIVCPKCGKEIFKTT